MTWDRRQLHREGRIKAEPDPLIACASPGAKRHPAKANTSGLKFFATSDSVLDFSSLSPETSPTVHTCAKKYRSPYRVKTSFVSSEGVLLSCTLWVITNADSWPSRLRIRSAPRVMVGCVKVYVPAGNVSSPTMKSNGMSAWILWSLRQGQLPASP